MWGSSSPNSRDKRKSPHPQFNPITMVKEKKEMMKRNRELKPIEGGIKWKNKQKRILLIVEEEVLLKTTTTFI
ncbi:hypothetical protein Ccrd_005342 [Cynara cardunculus var. scolymus]|uniref:Uncharacterized protein n=1 Tax=Cynara cardunculus var. scolymus TaxID=59895 RepID=A0A103XKS9_CYNCS|nr:hypothetical protein Ccrd_005342 [Cynara cardunculus var. scolymus]